jgi:S-DNA-T family DNA segregation ATPase FtsK/SpoIIIE
MQIAFAGPEPGRDGAQWRVLELAGTPEADLGDEIAESATHPPGARRPVRLRPLPRSVGLAELPRREGLITLGLGGDAAVPVSVDLFAGAARMLVAGPPRSGRSTVLRAILAQAVRVGQEVVVGAGIRSPLRRMADELHVRVVDPCAPAERIGPAPQGRSLLLVDDCERYADEPAGEVLSSWVRDPDAVLAAVVAGRTEELATSYRGLGAQVRRTNCGLLLRPGPVDGELLGVRLPRRPSSGPPGRGVLVGDPHWGPPFDDGDSIPLQAALP